MSRYVFKVSKNSVTSQHDEFIELADDSVTPDVTAYLFLDDEQVFYHTVSDIGGHLEYTCDLDQGDHHFQIKTEQGSPTDIHIDYFYIDDKVALPTQYNLWDVVYGYNSLGKHKLCRPYQLNRDRDYVWWGEVYTNEGVENTNFYRPHIVSDLNYFWRFNFQINSNNNFCYTHHPDTADILYDSTESFEYYFISNPYKIDFTFIENSFFQQYEDFLLTLDSTKVIDWQINGSTFQTGIYQGVGTYSVNNLEFLSTNLNESDIGRNQIILFGYEHYISTVCNYWYHKNYTLSPITVS